MNLDVDEVGSRRAVDPYVVAVDFDIADGHINSLIIGVSGRALDDLRAGAPIRVKLDVDGVPDLVARIPITLVHAEQVGDIARAVFSARTAVRDPADAILEGP